MKRVSFHWSVYVAIAIMMIMQMIQLYALCPWFSPSGNGFPYKFVLHLFVLLGLILFLICRTRWSLIVLAVLFAVKLVFPSNIHSDIPYAFILGSNTIEFIRDVFLLPVSLFIKRDGFSGWQRLFRPQQVSPVLEQNTQTAPKEREPISKKTLKTMAFIIAPIMAALIVLVVLTMSKDYPDYVITFKDKVSVILGIPNNEMASLSFGKSLDAGLNGLYEKEGYYIEWAERFNPNDVPTMWYIAKYHEDHDNYASSIYWLEKIYKKDPTNHYKEQLASAYFRSKQDVEKAVKMAESVIENDRNSPTACSILRDYYYESGDVDAALYWAVCWFDRSGIMKGEEDLTIMGNILTHYITPKLNISDSAYLVVYPSSNSFSHKFFYDMTEDEFYQEMMGWSTDNVTAIRLKKVLNIPPRNYNFYLVWTPEHEKAEIWDYDSIERSLSRLFSRFPQANVRELFSVEL